MKKFLRIISLFVVVVALCLATINQLYMSKYSFQTINNVPENIELCNFGNSQPYNGIKYALVDTDLTCFNFALPAQSFDYDYRILQNYADHLKPGAKVLICCSWHALFGKPETEGSDFASKNRRYYTFLPKKLIKQYDLSTQIFVKYLPALTAGDALVPTILGIYEDESNVVERTTAENAKKMAENRFNNLFGSARDEKDKIVYDTEDVSCLREMIRYVKELGCEPILVTTPYLKEFGDVIKKNDPELLDGFYETMQSIVNEENIKYYDWSQDNSFSQSYDLFMNLDHLNTDGAVVFTDMLIQAINEDD